jgi:biotin carboxylase
MDFAMFSSSMNLQGKTILLVSIGSIKKRFILKRMHELGLKIVVLHDQRVEWASTFVSAWVLASYGESVEVVLDRIAETCASQNIQLDGAITFWEEEVPLLAYICERFGLIGNSLPVALNTRSKFAMQELVGADSVTPMRQHLLKSEQDLEEAIRTVGFPAVMKPLYGADSLSVVYVNSPEEARKMYKFVLESFTAPYEKIYKYEKDLVVYQEYIPGMEFSLECVIQNGVPRVAGILQKDPMELPFFIETGDVCPAQISPKECEVLANEAKRALVAVGVQNSIAHVELKLMPDGTPHLIEVASRMGGDSIYSFIKFTYGFDLVKAGCEIAMGVPLSEQSHASMAVYYDKYIVPKKSGVVVEMKGFETIADDPLVVDHCIFVKLGSELKVAPKGFDTAGWIMVKANSYQEAQKIMGEIMGGLTLTVKPK